MYLSFLLLYAKMYTRLALCGQTSLEDGEVYMAALIEMLSGIVLGM
jgi:hypothetical protein